MDKDSDYLTFLDDCALAFKAGEIELIKKAYDFALIHHKSDVLYNHEALIKHSLGISEILLDLNVDSTTIIASIIHETINYGDATKEEIESLFGSEVYKIVKTISKLNTIELTDNSELAILNLRKVLVGMCEDVRVLFLKLAHRLHFLRNAINVEPDILKKKINETEHVLIPIAHRLGLYKIKGEMEDLCLKYSKPEVYNEILERLNTSERELRESLSDMEDSISEMLMEQNISFRIKSRVKSVYSIYNKLNNGKTWDSIYDILALRVIVNKVSECYLTVGLIHAKYRPIPGRFKDYIAMPKANMYQSLHTGVFGPDGHRYEVQIRTEEMDEFAEKGVASHFAYKEKHYMRNILEQKLEILRNMIESADTLSDLEFENIARNDILNDSIYVFTPKGDVLELPKGSTPLDFAYRIHSDVGDHAVQAIVNDIAVPLNYELHSDDVVKIRTKADSTPSKEWLSSVKTSHARNKIKAYFSKQDKDEYTESGKVIFQNELRKRKLSIDDVLTNDNVKKLLEDLKLNDLDDVYLGIGSLRYTAAYILNLLDEGKKESRDILLEKMMNHEAHFENQKGDILVDGNSGILVNLAKCCYPVYGDDIKGYITKGEGVSVHRTNCYNLKGKEERFIDVSWVAKDDNTFYTKIVVTTDNGENYLLDIIGKATTNNVRVESVKRKSDDMHNYFELLLKVANKDVLEIFMNSLLSYKFILKVERI